MFIGNQHRLVSMILLLVLLTIGRHAATCSDEVTREMVDLCSKPAGIIAYSGTRYKEWLFTAKDCSGTGYLVFTYGAVSESMWDKYTNEKLCCVENKLLIAGIKPPLWMYETTKLHRYISSSDLPALMIYNGIRSPATASIRIGYGYQIYRKDLPPSTVSPPTDAKDTRTSSPRFVDSTNYVTDFKRGTECPNRASTEKILAITFGLLFLATLIIILIRIARKRLRISYSTEALDRKAKISRPVLQANNFKKNNDGQQSNTDDYITPRVYPDNSGYEEPIGCSQSATHPSPIQDTSGYQAVTLDNADDVDAAKNQV